MPRGLPECTPGLIPNLGERWGCRGVLLSVAAGHAEGEVETYWAVVFGSIFAWWRSFLMQPFEMGDQLRLTSPTAKVETEHLIGAFGRRTPDPQADQQAGDQGHIDLHPN